MRKILLALALLLTPAAARAQCSLPVTLGETWTVAQWNNCFNYLLAQSGGGGSSSNFNASFPAAGIAIGAYNGGNMVYLGSDAFHDLNVNVATALPAGTNVIGGVTQSGNWAVTLTGSVPLPNGAATSLLQGGIYNSSVPTLSNGQQTALQTDVNGNLKVNVVAGGSGGSGGGTSSSFTSTFPVTGTAIGAYNSGNMTYLGADSAHNLLVNLSTSIPTGTNSIGAVTQGGAWAVALSGSVPAGSNVIGGVTQSGTWSVNVGTSGLPAGAATSANQTASQGSATGGTAGTTSTLSGGIYNASALSLTTGQQAALQMDVNGNLKVNVQSGGGGGGSGSSFGTTFPTSGTAIGAKNGANMVNLAADGSSNLMVNLAANNVGLATLAAQTAVTGTVAAGTAATNSLLTGAVYNSTQPTPTTGQQVAFQADPHGNLRNAPGSRTLVALDIATVTTGGTAVNALSAGHRTGGGWLLNPSTATIPLCINEIATASGTTSAGSTSCIPPGSVYNLAPATAAVSVVSSDSSHAFSGEGYQ